MLFWIFAAVIVYAVQVFIPPLFLLAQTGIGTYLGARDNEPALGTHAGRARRAVKNMQENMPVFLAFAVLAIVLGKEAGLALLGAQIFVLARVGFAIVYQMGVPVLRSALYLTGFAGLAIMAFGLVG
jgi:uncharacterized MAPEG superfamily protein